MGDPKKISNKFSRPSHPWNKARLEQEKPLMLKYGLTNKKELWKVSSKLKTFKQNSKRLVALKGAQAERERQQMFERMKSYGLVGTNSLDEILGMQPEQLLDRRLQTIVVKKGLARTMKQARQMITHRHIVVNGRKVTAPGYLVKVGEEHTIEFYPGSNFFREDHPERPLRVEVPGKKEKEEAEHASAEHNAVHTGEKKEEEKGKPGAGRKEGKEGAEKKKAAPRSQREPRTSVTGNKKEEKAGEKPE
jgi:small subunit ribosomal protein S4